MHHGEHPFGFEGLGVVAHHGEVAQPGLDPLGDRSLSDHAPQDEPPGGIEPPAGQGVDNVIPSSRLDRIERLWRLGAALAGYHRHD